MTQPLGFLAGIPAAAIVEALSDAVLLVDDQGDIRGANRSALRMFDHTWPEFDGKSVEDLVPAASRRQHGRERKRYLKEPRSRRMGTDLQLYAVRRDGTEFPVDIGLTPLDLDGRRFVLAVVRDLTDRLRLEETLLRLGLDDAEE